MSKMGIDPLRIANRLHVSEDEVKTLIEDFESRRLLASSEIVDWLTNVEGLIAVDGAGMDIQAARQALRFTGRYDKDDQPIYERDWNTTLEAIDRAVKMVEVAKPKGGGVTVNTAIQNNANLGGAGNGQGRSFEALLREAEKKYKLEAGHPDIIEAEIVDEGDEGDEDGGDSGESNEEVPDVELDDPDEAD